MAADPGEKALKALVWPRRITMLGLWAERLSRAFWPLWTILLLVFSAAAFGLQDLGPLLWVQVGAGLAALAALAALILGLRAFHRPTEAEALARLDAALPGRPIAALRDTQAIGAEDPASLAVWQAHQRRMAARAAEARPVAPDLRLSSRDPYSLRYVALTAAVMAALFGSLWRVTTVAGLAPTPAEAMPGGPVWEAWAQPPTYTGKPTLYLNDLASGTVEVPVGTRIQIRIYGPEGGLTVEQTVAQVAPPAPVAEGAAAPALPEGMAGVTDLTVSQSGRLAIEGDGGREWQIVATPDALPAVAVTGEMGREADGRFKQGFTASDDYGVVAGSVTISLDLAAVSRSHGLTIDPEEFAPLTLDLPMPVKGDRSEFTETLIDDVSKTIYANMPVSMAFSVTDAAAQAGVAAPHAVTLPGLRFFDPMAAAVIEMRRDLLWNRANLPRIVDILRAMQHRPEDLTRSEKASKRLRVLTRELAAMTGPMSDETRDQVAEELWTIAFMFEEGDLGSAYDRLQRAQDRLEEAIRNGASPEEIEELMREMQQAMREYTRELGEEAQRNPQEQGQQGQGQEITGDQLQEMLDEIQRLMEEGRTAEAMELMEQLRQLMENLQVTQGQGQGQGQGSPGQESMQELGEALRDQQELSDDAYRDMQRGRNGEEPGQDPGELADRQQELRDRLGQLQEGELPGDGTENGEAGRDALDRAEEAMREAERALEEGDLDGAWTGRPRRWKPCARACRNSARRWPRSSARGRRRAARRKPAAPTRRAAIRWAARKATPRASGLTRTWCKTTPTSAPGASGRDPPPVGRGGAVDEELDYLKRLLDFF